MSEFTEFDYLLNRFERASQADEPSMHGYGEHRRALFAYVRNLESQAAELAKLAAENARLRIRGAAYEAAFGIAYQATYQSHNGHWDSTMQGGAGCLECIRAREARENCDAELRRGLDALAARAQEKQT